EEQPDVVDLVLQHGNTLDRHAESEPRHGFRIVAHGGEDVGIDQPRAEDLQPPRRLAQRTRRTAALAGKACDVDLRARLGEREETGAEPQARLAPEDALQCHRQYALEVTKGDMAVYHEAFDLMEHRRVRHVVVMTVARPGDNRAQRRL